MTFCVTAWPLRFSGDPKAQAGEARGSDHEHELSGGWWQR